MLRKQKLLVYMNIPQTPTPLLDNTPTLKSFKTTFLLYWLSLAPLNPLLFYSKSFVETWCNSFQDSTMSVKFAMISMLHIAPLLF